ncbi:unnamed protein product [Prorocentrum cordatum]|uniref:C2 domain-containing protein n=1 Tax=Prorocentrum cordatum TaxID=2364126 RepID=A0ABN9UNJ0_9DINO|nr:unnamed protein product [Polarella glacialis]
MCVAVALASFGRPAACPGAPAVKRWSVGGCLRRPRRAWPRSQNSSRCGKITTGGFSRLSASGGPELPGLGTRRLKNRQKFMCMALPILQGPWLHSGRPRHGGLRKRRSPPRTPHEWRGLLGAVLVHTPRAEAPSTAPRGVLSCLVSGPRRVGRFCSKATASLLPSVPPLFFSSLPPLAVASPINPAPSDGGPAIVSELLGSCTLDHTSFQTGGFEGKLELDADDGIPATLEVKVLVVAYPPPPDDARRLFVKVCSGNELPYIEGNAFCKVLIPGREGEMVTRIGGHQLSDPMWNEENEMQGYQPGDSLKFEIFDYVAGGSAASNNHKLVATADLGGTFYPAGYEGPLPLTCAGGDEGGEGATLEIAVEVFIPPPQDPGKHVTLQDRQPVPFQLRSLETGRVHKLCAYTQVGRSRRELDPTLDLVLDNPGIQDVSRQHAVIKAWQGADASSWHVRAYSTSAFEGYAQSENGGHAGGGTCVDGLPVMDHVGSPLEPTSVLRFGLRELWTLERSAVLERSQAAEIACRRARNMEEDDPMLRRQVPIDTLTVLSALRGCADWASIVRVCLESIGEQDEPPCADAISVRDECGCLVRRHVAETIEEQEAYDVEGQLRGDIVLGASLELRLSSDPRLLGPLLQHLDRDREQLADDKDRELDGVLL